MLEMVFRFVKPEHNYVLVMLQLAGLYFLYLLYKNTVLRYRKYRAYNTLTKDRVERVIENVQPAPAPVKKEVKVVEKPKPKKEEPELQPEQKQQSTISYKELLKQEKQHKQHPGKGATSKITHELYLASVKGFGDLVTGFAFNNRVTCACSFDQTIKVFDNSEFFQNADNPKNRFYKLQDMHGTAICISRRQDQIHFVANNQLFELHSNPFQLISKTKGLHKNGVTEIHIDDEDRYLITTGSDTYIKVWGLNGDLLKEINTSYGEHFGSRMHHNQLVISSWTRDSAIWESRVAKEHQFRSIEKTFILKGDQKNSVIDASVYGDHAALLTKDTLKVMILDQKLKPESKVLHQFQKSNLTAVDLNDSVLVFAINNDLHVYDKQFKELVVIQGAANGNGIKKIRLHELRTKSNKPLLICYVWADPEIRINIFDLTRFQ